MKRRTFIKQSTAILAATAGGSLKSLAGVTAKYHVVTEGETLSSIGKIYGVNIYQIIAANDLKGNYIKPGDRIHIPQAILKADKITHVRDATDKIKTAFRRWQYIVIHHSGTHNGSANSFDEYHRHKRNMENGLAYHFVIGNGTGSEDGLIEIGDRWTQQLHGGHVKCQHYNEIGIGVCLVGNFESKNPTDAQMRSLTQLLDYFNRDMPGALQVVGHRELDTEHTLCPGVNFPMPDMHKRYS